MPGLFIATIVFFICFMLLVMGAPFSYYLKKDHDQERMHPDMEPLNS